eukprot:1773864-Pyramimonas_sp.AAC.1
MVDIVIVIIGEECNALSLQAGRLAKCYPLPSSTTMYTHISFATETHKIYGQINSATWSRVRNHVGRGVFDWVRGPSLHLASEAISALGICNLV